MSKEKSATHGRKDKGSAFWIQTLVNFGKETLEEAIKKEDETISSIKWLSPLKNDDPLKSYKEFNNTDLEKLINISITGKDGFWPKNGPSWDAVGQSSDGTCILIEAKAHLAEMNSHCGAVDDGSVKLIKKTMQEVWKDCRSKEITVDQWDSKYLPIWYHRYYQLANRLSFLHKLNKGKVKTKLVLLNIVNDPTYEPTTKNAWNDHYDTVFKEMLGKKEVPENVIIVNIDVG